MNNLVVKGLIVTAITFLAQAIATSGIPADVLHWQLLGLTLAGTLVMYIAQSLIIPTTSGVFGVNWKDLAKGALVALGNFLSGIGATYVMNTSIDWKALLTAAGTLLITYLAKQFITKPSN